MNLNEYQKINCERCVKYLNKNGFTFLFEMAGSGKTFQILTISSRLRVDKIIVVCPKTEKANKIWLNEASKLPNLNLPTLECHTYEELKKFELKIEPNYCLILDEVHKVKNPSSQISKLITGIARKVREMNGYVIGSTGTEIRNHQQDLFGIMKVIATPEAMERLKMRNKTAFTKLYCVEKIEYFGHIRRNTLTKEVPEAFHGLVNELKKNYGIYHSQQTQTEVKKMLPNTQRHIINIQIPSIEEEEHKMKKESLEKMLGEMVTQADRERMTTTQYDSMLKNVILQYASLRKIYGVKKVIPSIEKVKELQKRHGKLIVYTYHREVMTEISKVFDNKVTIDGTSSNKQRQEALEKFKTEECNYLFATIGACSTGVTLTQCNAMVFIEISYSPAEMVQAEARINRISQKKETHIYYIQDSRNFIENNIRELVRRKSELQEGVKI